MTTENLKNKIGFQIGFLLYSGETIDSTIERLVDIAIDYAKSFKDQKGSQWIKIQTANDLPKESCNCWVVWGDGEISTEEFDPRNLFQKKVWQGEISHYQEIKKPELSIS